jgi:hypothetical protein
MRKGIQESFLFSPVVSIHPVISNSLKIFSIESILKSNTFQTRYNSCCSTQSVMQIRQYLNFLNIQILNSNLIQSQDYRKLLVYTSSETSILNGLIDSSCTFGVPSPHHWSFIWGIGGFFKNSCEIYTALNALPINNNLLRKPILGN